MLQHFHLNSACLIVYLSYSHPALFLPFPVCSAYTGNAENICLYNSDVFPSPGKHSLPIVYTGTGVDGFNKDERWIWLWPADIKISPDLANRDYSASLSQQEVTARSMPCDPVHPISRGRKYGPPCSVCGSLMWITGYTNGDAWVSGEVLDADVSGFKVQLEFCSILNVSE